MDSCFSLQTPYFSTTRHIGSHYMTLCNYFLWDAHKALPAWPTQQVLFPFWNYPVLSGWQAVKQKQYSHQSREGTFHLTSIHCVIIVNVLRIWACLCIFLLRLSNNTLSKPLKKDGNQRISKDKSVRMCDHEQCPNTGKISWWWQWSSVVRLELKFPLLQHR